MPAAPRPPLLTLAGPTASGKTAMAHQLARRFGYEILSMDAMAVYRGMDVGTAKPSPGERAEAPYWGLDLADPSEEFSAGRFAAHAQGVLADATRRGASLLLTGGTGLYYSAVLHGLEPAPAADPAMRRECEEILARTGVAGLQHKLRQMDAVRLERLADPCNPRRLIRAIEQAGLGAPPAAWARRPRPRLVGCRWPRAELQARIAARVQAMFSGGLIEEARGLMQSGPPLSRTAGQAIGYREALALLDGKITLQEAITQTIIRTRQLAKRQLTWFRHQADVHWVDMDSTVPETVAASIVAAWRALGTDPD